MGEFKEGDSNPASIMGLPFAEFRIAVQGIKEGLSDEAALAVLTDCVDNAGNLQLAPSELRFKRGYLFCDLGRIEENRSNYDIALEHYRQSRAEIESSGANKIWTADAARSEGYIQIHRLRDLEAAIEPLEVAIEATEGAFGSLEKPTPHIPSDDDFEAFIDMLVHSAECYYFAGNTGKLEETCAAICALGEWPSAAFGVSMYGLDLSSAGRSRPLQEAYDQLRAGLIEPEEKPFEEHMRDLDSLEELISHPEFLPATPGVKDFLQTMVYQYRCMAHLETGNIEELIKYAKQGLHIAERNKLLVSQVVFHMFYGDAHAAAKRPILSARQYSQAFTAAERCLGAGASIKASVLEKVLESLLPTLHANGDTAGMERVRGHMAQWGIALTSGLPEAQQAHLS